MSDLQPHLAELRTRVILSLCAVGGLTLLFLIFYPHTWQVFMYPLRSLAGSKGSITLRGLGPLDGFMAVARFSFVLGFFLALPFVLYQIWMFFRPGLTISEKNILRAVAIFAFLFFSTGAAIAYFFAVPFILKTLSSFNANLSLFRDEWTATRYSGFLMMITCGMGLCFELPLLMGAGARMGLVSPVGVLKYWRQAVLAIFFIAAVLTPPDPASQILLATILGILYFGSYFLVKALWIQPNVKAPHA